MVQVLEKKLKRESAKEEAADDNVAKLTKLSVQFATMTKALCNDPIHAAKICPQFKVFLTNEQKQRLEQQLKDEDTANSTNV